MYLRDVVPLFPVLGTAAPLLIDALYSVSLKGVSLFREVSPSSVSAGGKSWKYE